MRGAAAVDPQGRGLRTTDGARVYIASRKAGVDVSILGSGGICHGSASVDTCKSTS